jgi:hypothetical protein
MELFWAFIVLTKNTDEKRNFVGYVKITRTKLTRKNTLKS